MAESQPIRHQDIFEDNVLGPFLAQMDAAIEKTKELEAQLKAVGGSVSAGGRVNTKSSVSEIQKLAEEERKLSEVEQGLETVLRQRITLEEKRKAIIKTVRDSVKDQIAQEKIQKGSLNAMRAELARLTKEYANTANPTKEFTSKVKDMTDKVKRAEEAIGDHRRSVGHYEKGIKGASSALQVFERVTGISTEGLQYSLEITEKAIKSEKAATLAQQLWNLAVAANPFVLAATALAALAVGIGAYIALTRDADKAQFEWTKDMKETIKQINELNKSANDAADQVAILRGEEKKAVQERRISVAKANQELAASIKKVTEAQEKVKAIEKSIASERGLAGALADKENKKKLAQAQKELELANKQYDAAFANQRNLAALGDEEIKKEEEGKKAKEKAAYDNEQLRIQLIKDEQERLEAQAAYEHKKRLEAGADAKLSEAKLYQDISAIRLNIQEKLAKEEEKIQHDRLERQKAAEEKAAQERAAIDAYYQKQSDLLDAAIHKDLVEKGILTERKLKEEAARKQYEDLIAAGVDETAAKTLLNDELARIDDYYRKQAAIKQIDQIKQITKVLEQAFDQRAALQKKYNEKQVSELDRQIEFQRQLAVNGQANTLAFLERERAKKVEEQMQNEKRQIRRHNRERIAEIFLEAIKAGLKEGGNGSFVSVTGKALAFALGAEGIAAGIVGGAFAEGVEDFKGKGTTKSDSNLIRFSNRESVVTADGTAENKGLVTAMNEGKASVKEWFMDSSYMPTFSKEQSNTANPLHKMVGAMIGELRDLKETVKQKKELHINRNMINELVIGEKENGLRKDYVQKRSPIIKRGGRFDI